MIKKSSSYIACLECRRVFKTKELEKQKKKSDENELRCPFCDSTRFTHKFTNVILCINPEKSKIAKNVEPEITKPGIYAYFLE